MSTQPLTQMERRWLRALNKLLGECPSDRLGFYTIGDRNISVYDKRVESDINDMMEHSSKDFGLCVDRLDACLGEIKFPGPVHSTAG